MPDPADRKPADWVEERRIRDPTDVKPADWDESQPEFVVDEAAQQPADWDVSQPEVVVEEAAQYPADWLYAEPLQVPDPAAVPPADWDEEEYGPYEAPLVPNPRCEQVSGCGVWEKPLVRNPAYKGPYPYRTIPNPAYKGPWMPRIIANPAHFEEPRPHNLPAVGGVAVEIWTMQAGLAFDNIVVTHDEKCAEAFADATFRVKQGKETGKEEEKGEKRRARICVGAYVNDCIDEVFNLEYDEARWRRVEKGMMVGGVVLAVASALVIYTNWRFIWRAVLFWGVCCSPI